MPRVYGMNSQCIPPKLSGEMFAGSEAGNTSPAMLAALAAGLKAQFRKNSLVFKLGSKCGL